MNRLIEREASSFRDPGATVYKIDNAVYRQINQENDTDYANLMQSGLYDCLISKHYLIPHDEVSTDFALSESASRVIKPKTIEFISYPYEWCFSQLKDAAILTLTVAKLALKHNMMLKDASAFNIQFINSKPIFIDTCSFSSYINGQPWVAYNQFCKHFLAPLVLMSQKDVRLNGLMKQFIDGIPLDLTSKMLSVSSWLSFGTLAHIHLHARTQIKYNDDTDVKEKTNKKVSKFNLLSLFDNLEGFIKKLKWKMVKTEWGDYYNNTNYSNDSSQQKANIIEKFVSKVGPTSVWDLGGNDGRYSRIAAKYCSNVICFDVDPVAVEKNYIRTKKDNNKILPLIQDLTNPSTSCGWAHVERRSLESRRQSKNNLVMALALIHHIAISNNVPLSKIAEYFAKLGQYLIIEFVPKEDDKVIKLLSSREDIFPAYNLHGFMHAFEKFFNIMDKVDIPLSKRSLYLMQVK